MSELVKQITDNDLLELQKNAVVIKFLNNHPKKEWIKEHPFAKGVDYLPVGKVEMLLDSIFGRWNFEVVDYKMVGNSITVHIRLTVINPVTGESIVRDGLGAVPLELEATKYDKDKKDQYGNPVIVKQGSRHAMDFEYLSRTAVMKNLPAAKSFALKDAADTLGNLFGRSLNRSEKDNFVDMYNQKKENFDVFSDEVKEKINSFKDADDLLDWAASQTKLHSSKEFENYVNSKRMELQNGK